MYQVLLYILLDCLENISSNMSKFLSAMPFNVYLGSNFAHWIPFQFVSRGKRVKVLNIS